MHSTLRGIRAACLATVVLAALAGSAAAAPSETELKARQAFASGRYDQALELFAKLYAETLHPTYLRNIGRCHQKMREPQKAIDAFHDYLAKSKRLPKDEQIEIQGYIKDMETLRDEQAKAAAPPPPVAPPVLTAPPPSTAPPPTTATATLTAAPPPPEGASHPFYTRWWF